jgi:CPA2 family monovalent cation:H+ antiporter-2
MAESAETVQGKVGTVVDVVTEKLHAVDPHRIAGVLHGDLEHLAQDQLTRVAVVALVALICGLIFTRFRQPAIVGYILAGVMLGATVIGANVDQNRISFFAELGVLMLLFVVGMELSLRALKVVWVMAVGSTLLQIGVSVGAMFALHFVFDLNFGATLLLAFVIAISSTAVAIKILESIGQLRTRVGRVAVSIMIAQDLAVVPMMLVIRGLSGDGSIGFWDATKIVGSIALLAALIVYLSRRRRISIPLIELVSHDPELMALTALAYCFGGAAISGAIGLSPAYGAFLAGLFIGNTSQRGALRETVEPIRNVLLMTFFVSIGLLLDIDYLIQNLWLVLLLWFLASIFKTFLNIGILRAFGETWPRAFLASMAIAQIGEFSFLLAQTGVDAGIINEQVHKLVVSVTVLSLAISPIWLAGARRLSRVAAERITSLGIVLLILGSHHESSSLLTTDGRAYRRLSAARYLRLKRFRATEAETAHSVSAEGDAANSPQPAEGDA